MAITSSHKSQFRQCKLPTPNTNHIFSENKPLRVPSKQIKRPFRIKRLNNEIKEADSECDRDPLATAFLLLLATGH